MYVAGVQGGGLGFNPLVIAAISSAGTAESKQDFFRTFGTSLLAQQQAQQAAPAQIPASPVTPMYARPTPPDDTLLIAGVVGGLAIIGFLVVLSRRR